MLKFIVCALACLTPTAAASAETIEFNGNKLPDGWQVQNEDRGSYVVEDGKLLVIANRPGSYTSGDAVNVFTTTIDENAGDWVIELLIEGELQTAREAIRLGITDAKGSTVFASLQTYGDKFTYWGLDVRISKSLGPRKASFSKTMSRSTKDTFSDLTEKVRPPWTLQLVKRGPHYFARAKAGAKNTAWVETPRVTVIGQLSNLVLFATQTQKVRGETSLAFDRLTINRP